MDSVLGYCELCHKRIMYAAVINGLEVCEEHTERARQMAAWDYEYREIDGRLIQFVRPLESGQATVKQNSPDHRTVTT